MKRFLALLLPICLLAFSSCSKEKENGVDKLIGTYYGTRTGNCTIVINGQSSTVPMNGSGKAMISRLSDNRIRLDYGGDIFDGTVADNHISFESVTVSSTDATGTLSLTISASGNVSGTIINIRETYSGSYYVQGSSFPVMGSGIVVLNKQ